MLASKKGLLITTDIQAKQLILFLNEEYEGKIVVKDLDDTHVLISPAYLTLVQTAVKQMQEENVFKRKDRLAP